jgi:hypothetical protein
MGGIFPGYKTGEVLLSYSGADTVVQCCTTAREPQKLRPNCRSFHDTSSIGSGYPSCGYGTQLCGQLAVPPLDCAGQFAKRRGLWMSNPI